MNMQVVRALANPTRIRLLDAIADGPATPKELSVRVDELPGVVGYHLKVLRATGCIQVADPDEVSAAEDRSYRLAPTATPTRRLARPRLVHSGPGHPPAAFVQSVLERGTRHQGENLFGERQDQLSCASLVVDREGWQEISAAIADALDRIWNAHEKSAARLSDSDEEGIEATVAVATFESSTAPAAPAA